MTNLNTPGQRYKDFKVEKVVKIAELQCVLIELTHEPTGAQVMHIANDDTENLFCLSFQTLPSSSNGVAHILEHTVLCGSDKFPVKDPFFAMNRRSLNTFMNALTGADFTCYPAATQVEKDFYNLLDVYLDAVFKPNLKELSFLQEGHRLEFAIPTDPNSPLEYKGIVFNEMKGALSSGSARLAEAMNFHLFPNLTYGFNSGGDPKHIPELTYEELVDFHKNYYHPSRCLFFFYGNLPLEKHLDFISEHALKGVEKKPPNAHMPLQPRFSNPKHVELAYPISADEDEKDQSIIAWGWLTCRITEQEELLALSLLEIILMDTDASPLKRALMNTGLCKQAGSYMESDYTEVPWIILLKGTNADAAEKLENVIFKTLEEIVEKGIPEQSIENALHRLEFHRSEITGDHAPFGLNLFMRSGLFKQHGANPENGLMIHSLFHKLREDIKKDPHYLTDLIKKMLIKNKHMVRIIMVPSKTLAAKELTDEQTALEAIKQKLKKQDIEHIIEKAKELAEFQKMQEEDNSNILPKVYIEDVPKSARNFILNKETPGPLEVYHHETFTNEIVYADLVFDLPEISEEDLPYVRLFGILLTQMGCGDRDYLENLDYIQANVGGISASLGLNIQAQDFNKFYPSIQIRGKALHRKAKMLFPLIHDFATSTDFRDIHRLKEVILKHYTGLQSSLNQSALKYAVNLSGSRINAPGRIVNEWYGLSYYYKIKEIATDWINKAPFLIEKLGQLQEKLLFTENPNLVITCDAAMYNELKLNKFYGLENLKSKPSKKWSGDYKPASVAPQGRPISSPVAFIGNVFETISYIHPDAPALNIASFLFDNLVLHSRVREQGGAYGAGAVSNTVSGVFYFYSYRDPNIVSTLEAFNASIQAVVNGEFDEKDLEEAKFEMIQSMDSPISPGSRGDIAYGWLREGKTLELRQKFRDKVLALTGEEVIQAVKNHIQSKIETGATIVFAGKELLEKENAHLLRLGKDPLVIEPL